MMETVAFLPEYFAANGYQTLGIGKLFHRHAPEGAFQVSGGREPGFGPAPPQRRYWDREETTTDWGPFPDDDADMPDYRSADWAIDRLEDIGESQYVDGRPFFLAVGFLRPHVPWHAPPSWFEMHPLDELELPPYRKDDFDDVPAIGHQVASVPQMPTTEWVIENGYWPAIVQSYLASVSFVDAQVGRVLDALEASPYADKTIVVLFSDHGYHIGEKGRFAKHSLWEEATRVPLIFSGPGVPGSQSVPRAVELLDIYPTLVDLAGLPENADNEGNSLRPLLENPDMNWPYAAVTTYGRNNHGVRRGERRYIRYEDGSEEYYDHTVDPNEWDNSAADAGNRAAMDELAAYLPVNNAAWSPASDVDVYEYFRVQKIRSLGQVE